MTEQSTVLGMRGDIAGLSSWEAAKRLLRFGKNSIAKKKRLRPLIAFIEKFNSPLLIVLIVVSIVSFFLRERTSAIIVLVMVCVSVVLDFVNTYKSEKAVARLVKQVVTTVTVVRDGKEKEVKFETIVPGDIVLLSAGDIVPADCEVLVAKDFFVNQSALTGESFPVEKEPREMSPVRNQTVSGVKPTTFSLLHETEVSNGVNDAATGFEAKHAIFMGTSIVTGFATVMVRNTGRSTEFGKIAERLADEAPETEFEKGIKEFSFFTMRVTFVLVAVAFLANAFLGKGIFDSFLFGIAIAIGLTPELLPVIMSVSLSHGSVRMSRKGVIVKNLSAIESFGGMNILCTDKTGTLTENKIALVKCVDIFGVDSDVVFEHAYIASMFHSGVRSPLDSAIKEYRALDISRFKKIDEIPFDFERKRDSVVAEKDGAYTLITKGAPEDLLRISSSYQKRGKNLRMTSRVQTAIRDQFAALSNEGFRVLGVAAKNIKTRRSVYEKDEEKDVIFIGFAAFLDPPKPTARAAIQSLERLGIEVKILTGDSELLTEKICREIGIPIKETITGNELHGFSDEELARRVSGISIFARITPQQKERVILALKKGGNAVGFLGDGINDAAALKAADVGISVNNAVDVAKETADIILLRHDLDVLREGVAEGRKTFQNTMKYVIMGLSSNFGNMFSMAGASLFLPFLPMLPSQILLNNFLYDLSQVALSSDNVDAEDVKRPPHWNLRFIKKYMFIIGPVSSVFDFVTFGLLFFAFRLSGSAFQTGWFIESLATQALVIYVIRTRKIPFLESKPSGALVFGTCFAVCVAWILPFFVLGGKNFFGFTPLHPLILAAIAGVVIMYLFVVEFVKRRFYKAYGMIQYK